MCYFLYNPMQFINFDPLIAVCNIMSTTMFLTSIK